MNGAWLDSIGSNDSLGRAVWALGVTAGTDPAYAPVDRAEALLRKALPVCETVSTIRSKAFITLGLVDSSRGASTIGEAPALVRMLADSIANSYDENASTDWRWFEDHMTYCNARLPHALLAAARLFPAEERYVKIATDALDFLLKSTHNEKGSYSPVGNAPMTQGRWFQKGDPHPPLFDQQPVDAGALVECCAVAYEVTAEPRFRNAAYQAYGWYFGENVHSLPVYDASNGGVCDALTPSGLNINMGAESVLSIHLAAQALSRIE
jgi:hypothetical protein